MSFVKKAVGGLLGIGGKKQGQDLAAQAVADLPDVPDPNQNPETADQITQARNAAVQQTLKRGRRSTFLTGQGGRGLTASRLIDQSASSYRPEQIK